MRKSLACAALLSVLTTAVSACGSSDSPGSPTAVEPTGTASALPSTQTSPPAPAATSTSAAPTSSAPRPGTVPPTWLGTRALPTTAAGFGEQQPTPRELRDRRFTLRDVLPSLPGSGFASKIASPAPATVIARSTWKKGCPVAATDLAWIRLTFWGFDHRRHTGELLVHRTVASDMVSVFRTLYEERYPIEEMRITTVADLDAAPTGDGNDTSAFACRPVVGSTITSQHAYGLAIDVNSFQNPYVKGELVLPELAGAYLDRSWIRPGMIRADDVVVRAFARIGWEWGGYWRTLKDYQHFSANGR